MLAGATGYYESALLEVVKFVDSQFPTNLDRVVLGQGMGGGAAIKMPLKYPEVFIAGASQVHLDLFSHPHKQVGILDLNMLISMYKQYAEKLNSDYPQIFDAFGPGTFDLGKTGKYPLPNNAADAFSTSALDSNNPMQLFNPNFRIPFYLEVEPLETNQPLIFNSTMNFCQKVQSSNSPGRLNNILV